MAIEIRPATPQDYDDLCALLGQVDALHRNNLSHLYQKPRGPVRDRNYILSLIADDNVGLFVAEATGVVVGFVHVEVYDSPPIPIFVQRRYAVVDNLVVDKHFQRGGLGRTLMEQAHRWAADHGATEVELTVYDFNETARAFYEGLGYVAQSTHMYRHLKQDLP